MNNSRRIHQSWSLDIDVTFNPWSSTGYLSALTNVANATTGVPTLLYRMHWCISSLFFIFRFIQSFCITWCTTIPFFTINVPPRPARYRRFVFCYLTAIQREIISRIDVEYFWLNLLVICRQIANILLTGIDIEIISHG